MNKVVAILMVFLLIATSFIQSVSAEESNMTVESSESTGKEESNGASESTKPPVQKRIKRQLKVLNLQVQ